MRELILNTEHSVINADCLTYAGNTASLAGAWQHPRHTFCQVNICDRQALSTLFAKHQPDVVIHLAAESHVDRSIECSAPFIESNIVGSHTLLETCRHYWEGLDSIKSTAFRFLHVSTDEVYGDLASGIAPFKESTSYAPSSPYAASKAASDHLARAWHRTYGLPVVVTNCSNNYGPYQFPEKLIPHAIINALEGKPLPVYGDGKQVRDWLYVEDHAQALILAATQGQPGETYNIGSHCEQPNLLVVETICDLLEELAPEHKRRGLKHYRDLITHVADRPGHDKRYAINAEKFQTTFDWYPAQSFETGLSKTLHWYLDNRIWWQKLVNSTPNLQHPNTP